MSEPAEKSAAEVSEALGAEEPEFVDEHDSGEESDEYEVHDERDTRDAEEEEEGEEEDEAYDDEDEDEDDPDLGREASLTAMLLTDPNAAQEEKEEEEDEEEDDEYVEEESDLAPTQSAGKKRSIGDLAEEAEEDNVESEAKKVKA